MSRIAQSVSVVKLELNLSADDIVKNLTIPGCVVLESKNKDNNSYAILLQYSDSEDENVDGVKSLASSSLTLKSIDLKESADVFTYGDIGALRKKIEGYRDSMSVI